MQDRPPSLGFIRTTDDALPTFEDPVYSSASDIEEFDRIAARVRRRLTRRQRKRVKKASKLRRYRVDRCLIQANWEDVRFATIFMLRHQPNDELAVGSALVDLACLGLKDTIFHPRIDSERARETVFRFEETGNKLTEYSPGLAAKVLVHGVAYATRLGFAIPPDYFVLRAFFGEPDPPETEPRVPLGHRGKPFFVAGPYDDTDAVMSHLEKRLGPNGFYVIVPTRHPTSDG
ncbi:MAG: hypothetical protein ABEK29_00460 [Bradymonadaceae bacterium]